jgi:hypothetical protein
MSAGEVKRLRRTGEYFVVGLLHDVFRLSRTASIIEGITAFRPRWEGAKPSPVRS